MFGKHSVSVNYHMVLNLPEQILNWGQRAKKVTSNSPGLVDFAIGRVIFVLQGAFSIKIEMHESSKF